MPRFRSRTTTSCSHWWPWRRSSRKRRCAYLIWTSVSFTEVATRDKKCSGKAQRTFIDLLLMVNSYFLYCLLVSERTICSLVNVSVANPSQIRLMWRATKMTRKRRTKSSRRTMPARRKPWKTNPTLTQTRLKQLASLPTSAFLVFLFVLLFRVCYKLLAVIENKKLKTQVDRFFSLFGHKCSWKWGRIDSI